MRDLLKRRVIIVEDDKILRESYETIVNSSDKFVSVGAYRTSEEAIADLTKKKPDIVLMDIELPGQNGIEATQKIKDKLPNVEVVIVTVYEDNDLVFEALKVGASGYITKSANYLELLSALEEIVKGGAPMSTKIARMVIKNFHQNPNSPLTKREKKVLELLSVGKTYSQISSTLDISPDTSKTHIRNIYSKLQVNKKSDAIDVANKNKLI
ncbi:MAG TPA: DNA-binding response regulator [Cytophagales bacterium]|nr:DNA-binding response regulator [Cytophagales bacterium]HCR54487.1 DNA-binding response regulator [Cytophagales bacterium]